MVDVRGRRSRGLNRSRVRLEVSRAAAPAVWVAVGLGIMVAGALFILVRVAPERLHKTYQARFAVSSATAIQPGLNDVKLKGVPIGTIDAIEWRGEQPVLRVTIQSKYGRVFRDAQAQLRPNTALQDIYLDITDRGTPGAGELGADDPLPASRTRLPVNISDVLNTFAPDQRLALRTTLDQLGNGMADRGRSLRAVFVQVAPFVRTAGEITKQLDERRPVVARLVHNLSILTRELGSRDAQLRLVAREGAGALETLQQGRGDLDATLRELPGTLRTLDTAFAATRGVLGDVDGALTALRPVAGQLPDSLDSLRDLSGDLDPAVRDLRPPVQRLVPLATSLRPLSADLDSAVASLSGQTGTLDKVTRDLADCKEGVTHFFQWNASMSKFGDSRGPVPRGNVVVGAQSSSLLNDPNEVAPQACTPGRVIGGRVPEAKDKH